MNALRTPPLDYALRARVQECVNRGAIPRILNNGQHPYKLTDAEIAAGFLLAACFDLTPLQELSSRYERSLKDEVRSLRTTVSLVLETYPDELGQVEVAVCSDGSAKAVWLVADGPLKQASMVLARASSLYVDNCAFGHELPFQMMPFGYADLNEVAAQMYFRLNMAPAEVGSVGKSVVDLMVSGMRATAWQRLKHLRIKSQLIRLREALRLRHPDEWHDYPDDVEFRQIGYDPDLLFTLTRAELLDQLVTDEGDVATTIDEIAAVIRAGSHDALEEILRGYDFDPRVQRVGPNMNELFALRAITLTERHHAI